MITAYIGDRGSGKTLAMTIRLYNDFYLKNKKIFSNYGLLFGKKQLCAKLDKAFYDDFKSSKFELNNCAVAVDEAHVFVDGRRAMSAKNIMFSKFVTQSRKRDVDLFYTTQDVSIERFLVSGQVELRLRKLTDEIIFCKTITLFNDGKQPAVNYEHIINTKTMRMYALQFHYRAGQLVKKAYVFGNPFFKTYDTNEIIDLD